MVPESDSPRGESLPQVLGGRRDGAGLRHHSWCWLAAALCWQVGAVLPQGSEDLQRKSCTSVARPHPVLPVSRNLTAAPQGLPQPKAPSPGQCRAVWECPDPTETCRSHPAPLTAAWPVPGSRASLEHSRSPRALCPKGL